MKTIEAFECSDGSIFNCEDKAKQHEDDLLGQELDSLLKLFKFGGQLTRNDEYKGLMILMNNRKELKQSIRAILDILDHSETS